MTEPWAELAGSMGDAQWIHDDPERARLTFPTFGPVQMLVNYGFDRVRVLRPVPVGAAVAIRARLGDVLAVPGTRADAASTDGGPIA